MQASVCQTLLHIHRNWGCPYDIHYGYENTQTLLFKHEAIGLGKRSHYTRDMDDEATGRLLQKVEPVMFCIAVGIVFVSIQISA